MKKNLNGLNPQGFLQIDILVGSRGWSYNKVSVVYVTS